MDPRRLGAALALVACIMILVGTFSMRWLQAPAPHDGGVGLTGMEMCGKGYGGRGYGGGGGGDCKSIDWDQLQGGGKGDEELELLQMAAMVALIGSVLAAGLLGAVAGIGFGSKRSMSVITIFSTLGAILALLGAIATVVILRKYFKAEKMSFGYSFYVYAAGCVLGAIGSIVSRGGRGYATPRT
jgi:hypothetical protein